MRTRLKLMRFRLGTFVLAILVVSLITAILSLFLCTQEAQAAEIYNGSCHHSGYYEVNEMFGNFETLTLDQKNSTVIKNDAKYKFGYETSYNCSISNLKMSVTSDNKLILEYDIDTPFYTFFLGGSDIYPEIYINYNSRYGASWCEDKLPAKKWNENCDFAKNKHVLFDFNKDDQYLLSDLGCDIIPAIQQGDLEISLTGLTFIS